MESRRTNTTFDVGTMPDFPDRYQAIRSRGVRLSDALDVGP